MALEHDEYDIVICAVSLLISPYEKCKLYTVALINSKSKKTALLLFFFVGICRLHAIETQSVHGFVIRSVRRSNFVRGHDSTMWDIVSEWHPPYTHRSLSARLQKLWQVPQCHWFVLKQFRVYNCFLSRPNPG